MSRHLLHYNNISQLITDSIGFVSVLIVDVKGSVPQEMGAKMLVTEDCKMSPFEGTIGGGKLELKAIEFAKKMILNATGSGKSFQTWNLQTEVGMTCGGEVKLFFELFCHSDWEIIIFGAGHVSQALVPLLLSLSCRVKCIDHRQELLNKLPDSLALEKVCVENPKDQVRYLSDNSFVLSMTQGHSSDVPILEEILKNKNPCFLGVIGSHTKSLVMKKELIELGIDKNKCESIHCPVGLPIGDCVPSEIAISIAAQLLEKRGSVRHRRR